MKRERVEHANALIKVISDHGRRFFFDKRSGRVARFEIDLRGRIWYFDEYTSRRLYCHKTPFQWAPLQRGFSNGGTLRSLLLEMVEYIQTGKQLWPGYIRTNDVPLRSWKNCPDAGWIRVDSGVYYGWGYDEGGAQACRDAALILPIMRGYEDAIEQNLTYTWREAA